MVSKIEWDNLFSFICLKRYVLGLLYTFNISRNLSTSSILFEGIFASELDEMW